MIHSESLPCLQGWLSFFCAVEIKKAGMGLSPRLPSMYSMFAYNIVVAINSALINEHCYVSAPLSYQFRRA